MSDYVLPTESVIAWRRHIHQHPELSFHETKTADYIAGVLEGIDGLKVERDQHPPSSWQPWKVSLVKVKRSRFVPIPMRSPFWKKTTYPLNRKHLV